METIQIGDKEITLIKTAHVSKQSVDEVKSVIDQIQPDTICIELDEQRAQNLFKKQDYSDMKLSTVHQGKEDHFSRRELHPWPSIKRRWPTKWKPVSAMK